VDDREIVAAAFRETAALHERLAGPLADGIIAAADAIRRAILSGGKVLAFGNGGSATDAQHLAGELVGRFMKERRAAAALALTADGAVVTALANDYGYDTVFARQVEALGQSGDVAVGITTSGASKSVNLALERARAIGLTTIGLTGRDGGDTGRLVDVHVNVPSAMTARVQEVQRTILHVICELVERDL
jgi:D-sedoheptulose 7-phosphate isomerase